MGAATATRVADLHRRLFLHGCTAPDRPGADGNARAARHSGRRRDDGDAEPVLHARDLAALDVPAQARGGDAAQLANDRAADALATLERLAALGVHSPVEQSPEFAALQGTKEFQAVAKKIAANLRPQGRGEIAFSLPGMTGVIEGVAWREKTGEFFFGDPHHRGVWVRTPGAKGDAQVRRFTPEGEELWGVLGLAVDEANGVLWAATAAVPAMAGFMPPQDGTAGLAEIDLATGAVRRVIPVVRGAGDRHSHVLGDLALGPDGSVYVPDSGAPVVWRLAPGGAALERLVESTEFLSLQGAAVSRDGSALWVADHANGLLRIDLASLAVSRPESPANTTLLGLEALVRAPNGNLIAVQNGVRPTRVLRIALDASGEGHKWEHVLQLKNRTWYESGV